MSKITDLIKEININKLPFVSIDDRNNLPNDYGGCYFVVSKNILLYIGQTTQDGGFRNRWSGHHRLQQMLQFVEVKIHYYKCSDDLALELEGALIKIHNPLLQNTKVPTFSTSKIGLLEQKNTITVVPEVIVSLQKEIDLISRGLDEVNNSLAIMTEYIKSQKK